MRPPGLRLLLPQALLLVHAITAFSTTAAASRAAASAASRAAFAFSAGLLHPHPTSIMARAAAAAAASTRRHASSALRTAGPVSASSATAAAALPSLRRSSRLLSTLNDGEGAAAIGKKKGAAKGSKSQKEDTENAAATAAAAPAPKKRGRPRKAPIAEPEAASTGKKPRAKRGADAAAVVTTLAVSSSASLELVVEGEAPRRRTKRRTSKDSDMSDAPSDATAAASAAALLLEEVEEAVAVEEVSGPPSLDPSWERRLEGKDGIGFVYGVDEAGRGPLAGPVVAGACYIPSHVVIPGIQDSKAMDEPAREAAYAAIVAAEAEGVRWAVQVVDHARIDEINILQATMEAMRGALGTAVARHGPTDAAASYALVDGNRVPSDLPTPLAGADCVVKGDSKVRCIAAASILAKVTRDRIMMEYHDEFPQYNFAQHKGYPTPAHKAALLRHGPCSIHRMTFKPIKK